MGSALENAYPQDASEIAFDAITSRGNGEYVGMVKNWLESQGVIVVPSDINTHITAGEEILFRPGQGVLRSRLAQILSHAQKVDQTNKQDRSGLPVEDWMQHDLAWSAYQHFRQYLLLAHFGYMVGRCEDQLQPGDAVGLVIGSGHSVGVPQKAKRLGVPLWRCNVHSLASNPLHEVMFRKAMPEGRMSLHDLQELATYNKQSNTW